MPGGYKTKRNSLVVVEFNRNGVYQSMFLLDGKDGGKASDLKSYVQGMVFFFDFVSRWFFSCNFILFLHIERNSKI